MLYTRNSPGILGKHSATSRRTFTASWSTSSEDKPTHFAVTKHRHFVNTTWRRQGLHTGRLHRRDTMDVFVEDTYRSILFSIKRNTRNYLSIMCYLRSDEWLCSGLKGDSRCFVLLGRKNKTKLFLDAKMSWFLKSISCS